MQYWLVTQFHEAGSLFDHLERKAPAPREAHTLVVSALRGLNHLVIRLKAAQGVSKTV